MRGGMRVAALCLLWTAGLPCTDCIDCNAGSYTAPGTCVDLLVGGVAWEDEFYRNCGFFYNAFTCSVWKNRTPDSGLYCCTCGGGETQVSETCLECPTNSNSPVGSSVSTACTCNAGSTGPDGGTCLFCVAGKYTALVGSTACVDCEVGTYSASVGATQSSTCVTCPTNADSSLGSSVSTACTCNSGSTGPDGGLYLHTHTHTSIYVYIHTSRNTCVHIFTYICHGHAHTHASFESFSHAYKHTYMRAFSEPLSQNCGSHFRTISSKCLTSLIHT